jgi:hypothetical protein
MSVRTKKLIGLLIMLFWLAIYIVVAVAIGIHLAPHANALVQFLYYALAGTLWIIPIGLLLPWMYREPDSQKKNSP